MKSRSDHLHLGCGLTAPKGWVNVDGSVQVVPARHSWIKRLLVWMRLLSPNHASIPWSPDVVWLDVTKPLPFPVGSFRALYCSHLLEHLYQEDALFLLRECYRILKPGGVCRFVVPDLESIVGRYIEAKERGEKGVATRMMEEMLVHDKQRKRGLLGLYQRMTGFHQHKWMYDAASLKALFVLTGFSKVQRADFLDSRIARIQEVEDPNRILNGQGIVVEGLKE